MTPPPQAAQYIEACKIKAEFEARLKIGQIGAGGVPMPSAEIAPPATSAEDWLTVDEAAEYLKIKKCTVQEWVRRGKLKRHGTGRKARFTKSALDRALKAD
jgi:excisionase family DNA binding protein